MTFDEREQLISELHALYHTLWTIAVGTPAYDKVQWQRVSEILAELGVQI